MSDFAEDTNVPTNDLISRQAAIDAVNVGNLHPGITSALKDIIEEIPSAEPYTKRRLPLKLIRIYGMIVPVVCNAEDAQMQIEVLLPNCGTKEDGVI